MVKVVGCDRCFLGCSMALGHLLLLVLLTVIVIPAKVAGQTYFPGQKAWLLKAKKEKPALQQRTVYPVALVDAVKDGNAFQGYRMAAVGAMETLYAQPLKKMSGAIADFGEHLTGYFSFRLTSLKGTPDAPVKVRLTFGEVPAEVAVSYDDFTGELSRGWLQDETITVTTIPAFITLPRRLAFRYVKIELLGSSPWFDVAISNLQVKAVTSARQNVAPLPATVDPRIRKIDSVGLTTLRECMQTVFEDGPKRDQRLWLGDLYLQSLASHHSYRSNSLVRRSLYLAAGLCDSAGYLPSNVFERPFPHAQQGAHIIEYSLLFNATLHDYVRASGDLATGKDLWPVARRQLAFLAGFVHPDSGFHYANAAKHGGAFIDWQQGLDKETSTVAAFIFAINKTDSLAVLLGQQKKALEWAALKHQLVKQLLGAFDASKQLFVSGPQKQISYASQIWAVLAGVLASQQEKALLTTLMKHTAAVKPFTPYLYSYFIEALIKAGMKKEAKNELIHYWGHMVEKGADTFWEVNDIGNPLASPYNYFPLNSYCHAWSCTPVYFIRKYPEVFQ